MNLKLPKGIHYILYLVVLVLLLLLVMNHFKKSNVTESNVIEGLPAGRRGGGSNRYYWR